jgi:hypothetical protein
LARKPDPSGAPLVPASPPLPDSPAGVDTDMATAKPAVRSPRGGVRFQLFIALRHRDFLYLWLSNLCNDSASWFQQITMPWVVWQISHSPFWVSVVGGMRSFPFLFIGPFAGVDGVGCNAAIQQEPDANGPRGGNPVGDCLCDPRIRRVDRLDQAEPPGMLPVDLKRIAGVVAVYGEGRDQHRAVDPDGVHHGHHVVARDLRRAGQDAGLGAARMAVFIGMHLCIYYHHDVTSHECRFFPRSLAYAVHRICGNLYKKHLAKPSRGFPEHAHRYRPGAIRYPSRLATSGIAFLAANRRGHDLVSRGA